MVIGVVSIFGWWVGEDIDGCVDGVGVEWVDLFEDVGG